MKQENTITEAKYMAKLGGESTTIHAKVSGKFMCVPLDPDNRHYAEILRQVDAGTLTIAAAD